MSEAHGPVTVRAPRGPEKSCKGWVQEAALRMLMNNLDPEVAERPQDLVVYGGRGKAARDWPSFHRIVKALRELEADETLLVADTRGLMRSTDGGGTFTRFDRSPTIRALAEQDGVLYAATHSAVDGYTVGASLDGGATWTKAADDAALPEPTCQGSLLAATRAGQPAIFFLNPAGKGRANGTLRRSDDGGKTWTESTLLFPGPFAYSSMAKVGADIGVLYEPNSNTVVLFRKIGGADLADK